MFLNCNQKVITDAIPQHLWLDICETQLKGGWDGLRPPLPDLTKLSKCFEFVEMPTSLWQDVEPSQESLPTAYQTTTNLPTNTTSGLVARQTQVRGTLLWQLPLPLYELQFCIPWPLPERFCSAGLPNSKRADVYLGQPWYAVLKSSLESHSALRISASQLWSGVSPWPILWVHLFLLWMIVLLILQEQ